MNASYPHIEPWPISFPAPPGVYMNLISRSIKQELEKREGRETADGAPATFGYALEQAVQQRQLWRARSLGRALPAVLVLRSGEVWVFRADGTPQLTVEPSVYLEKGRLRPRAAKQVVLSGRAMEYATRIRWSLAKAQDTAIAVRDLVTDETEPTH